MLVDGLGPDGNQDVKQPYNAVTCDANGDGVLEGNRLFSRAPLIVHLLLCANGCQTLDPAGGQTAELWVIVVHLKSHIGDSSQVPYTLPRRMQQVQFVASLARSILAANPQANCIALGDFNDIINSQTMAHLTDTGLADLWLQVEPEQRYSYIYQGISQGLDHILVHLSPQLRLAAFVPLHVNADYPIVFEQVGGTFYRSSDHDPLLAQFRLTNNTIYLPLLSDLH